MSTPVKLQLTPEQKNETKLKLLASRGLRVAEIETIAKTYGVSKHVVREALREIRKNLTKQEAAKLI
jgi:hypothetical protein